MDFSKLIRSAGLAGCAVLILTAVAAAQKPPGPGGPGRPGIGPPATIFMPGEGPGQATDGAIIMYPPVPPGAAPSMFWQQGDHVPEMVKPSDHWLGLQCGKVDPALQAQLGLDEGKGILVEDVVKDTPAAKAGIQKYDIMVRAGDRELTKIQDLIDEVDKVKDKKLPIELVRKGEKKTVEIVPEKRPALDASGGQGVDDSPEEWKNFFDYMQQWEPGEDGRPAMKFRFWRQPGTIVPGRPGAPEKLPDNVKIEIRKQGEKPAEVTVTRGDDTWSVNENELDRLPADLRPHVERMLGAAHGPVGAWGIPPEGFKVPEAVQDWRGLIEKRFEEMNRRIDKLPNPLGDGDGALERRFEEMNRRLEQMRKSLDELRGRDGEKAGDGLGEHGDVRPEVQDRPKNGSKGDKPKEVPEAENPKTESSRTET
ncbi:MAG: S1C family serine protease [Thermoguttaceae bacterium]